MVVCLLGMVDVSSACPATRSARRHCMSFNLPPPRELCPTVSRELRHEQRPYSSRGMCPCVEDGEEKKD